MDWNGTEFIADAKCTHQLCLLGNFSCFLSSADFFQNWLFWKILSGIPIECQTIWIQIRPDILSGLIWFQNVRPDLVLNCLQKLSADNTRRQRSKYACTANSRARSSIFGLSLYRPLYVYQKLFVLFLNQNICCGCSKDPSQYVVGTQKIRLNETVLLSTQNICLKLWGRTYLQFYAENFVYLNLCFIYLTALCM